MLIGNIFYETGITYPITGLDRLLQLPEYLNKQYMKVRRLSALCMDCLYPKEISLELFLFKAESIPGSKCSQKD